MPELDSIVIRDIECYGYHGVYSEETKLGQRFVVHLQAFLSIREAAEQDDVALSVDYGKLVQRVRQIVEGPSVRLIETLAVRICDQLLAEFALLEGLRVEVVKPNPPIPGFYGNASIQIQRMRST